MQTLAIEGITKKSVYWCNSVRYYFVLCFPFILRSNCFYIYLLPVLNLTLRTESVKSRGGKLLYKSGCVYTSF